MITLTFPAVLDDVQCHRPDVNLGLSTPTPVPREAIASIKKRWKSFGFEHLIEEVPLLNSMGMWPVDFKHARLKPVANGFMFVEIVLSFSKTRKKHQRGGGGGMFSFGKNKMPDDWRPSRMDVDDVKLLNYVKGQLTDGWGEGVSQLRFGPRVSCPNGDLEFPKLCRVILPGSEYEDGEVHDSNIVGRYSFNLTTIGCTLWPRDIHKAQKEATVDSFAFRK
jgi:hypothetical protein